MVREIYGRQPGDPMKDLDVNLALGMFVNTTLRAAVHLVKDYDTNLRFVKNYLWTTTGHLCQGNSKADQWSDGNRWHKLDYFQDLRWMSTSLLHSRAHQFATAKVSVFSDSVLCMVKMGNNPVESWKEQTQRYSDTNYFSELNRIDGQPVEFEWKIFPGFTTVGFLSQIHQMMGELQCERENFTGRIIFM